MSDQNFQAVCMGTGIPEPYPEIEQPLTTYLLSCVQEAVAAVDENHVIIYWNPLAEQLTGLARRDAAGRPAGEVLHLKSLSGKPALEDLVSGNDCEGEFLCCVHDGAEFPIVLRSRAMRDGNGAYAGFAVTFRDITEEKRREAHAAFFGRIGNQFSLRTTEREILEITAEQTAEYLAASAGVLFGEVCEGGNGIELLNGNQPQQDRKRSNRLRLSEAFPDGVLKALAAGRVATLDGTGAGGIAAGSAGSGLVPVAGSAIMAPHLEGDRLAFVLIARHGAPRRWREDETAVLRTLAERIYRRILLARTEERLAFQANLISNVQEAVSAADDQWKVVYWNKAAEAMYGWTADEMIGRKAGELARVDVASVVQEYKNGIKCDEHRFDEVTCYHKDGHPIDTEVHIKILYDAGGKLSGSIFSTRDITKRWLAEDALQQSERRARCLAAKLEEKNKFITDFFINVSHEFKTPLAIMMLGLELIESKMKKANSGMDISRNLSVMKQNSYRLNRLVSNLLDITKLDAGFMEPKWETTDIVSLLRNLALSTETYARQKKLTVRFTSGVTEKRFSTDSFMLERIMLNLLSNAIKHTPPGGRIDVHCGDGGGTITISVRDTGEGIPESKKSIIFDRFSQVDTSLARASEGSGIGLALTKSFVELLGGRIWFKSTAGVGSEFFVELPAVTRDLGQQEPHRGVMQLDKRVQMEFSDIGLSIS